MKVTFFALFFTSFLFCPAMAQTYQSHIEASYGLIEKEDYAAAEIELIEAMKLEPAHQGNVILLSNLGTIQRHLGKNQEALVSYTAALSRAPKNTTLLKNRAALCTEMGKYEDAITDYTSALLINENDENALYDRGMLYLQIKNFLGAQADFQKIFDNDSNTLIGRLGFASLYKLQGKYDDAEKLYIYLIDKMPDNPKLYAARSELYLLIDKKSRALADANKSIMLDEKDPYVYILRARIKLTQFEKEAAQIDIERAVSLGYDKVEAGELLKLCK